MTGSYTDPDNKQNKPPPAPGIVVVCGPGKL